MAVARHKTALVRTELSRPLAQALADGLICESSTVLDYGCGRGGDLIHLEHLGIPCRGWDPTFRPHEELVPASVVNLGFVLNVIEETSERSATLAAAWSFATDVLVVAVRMSWDARGLSGRPFRDGLITASGTFQKFFELQEMIEWVTDTIGTRPVVAAPGVFYVFRHREMEQQLLSRRVQSRQVRFQVTAQQLYDSHRDLLNPISDFISTHGRNPARGELPANDETAICERFGTLSRALSVLRKAVPAEHWEHLVALRRRDLLVYIALSRFGYRPRFSDLPSVLGRDIRTLFRSYEAACRDADKLLMALGRMDTILLAARASSVGKRTPAALYVHRSAVSALSPALRVYEGCAQVVVGQVADANIIKLSIESPAVSYLSYPDFDRVGHPVLHAAWRVDLVRQAVSFRDYSESPNPPILHRKENFVADDYPKRQLFLAMTRQEERAGLYSEPATIGTAQGWEAALRAVGKTVRGHRLVRERSDTSQA